MIYDDKQEIVAVVMLDGRPMKPGSLPELEAFLQSVINLDPTLMFEQAIWLQQMHHFLIAGVQGKVQSIRFRGKTFKPRAIQEGEALLDVLFQLDVVPRRALADLLSAMAKRLFQIATGRNPSLILNDK